MREKKLMIRVNDSEKDQIDAIAEKNGLPVASWARMALLQAMNGRPLGREQQARKRRGSLELLSLFCGIGGLDEGFRQAGFSTRLAFDIDAESVNTFNFNHADGSQLAFEADVRDLTTEKVHELAGDNFSPIGVLGGPPCQSFSVSNVHQKDDDPRHNLPVAYARLLKQLNEVHPLSFFVFENVPGLRSEKHRHRYEHFKELFQEAGFEISENVLDAQDFGVPQIRPRILIVGINRKLHPKAVWQAPEPERVTKTVRDTIEGLPEPIYNGKGLNPARFPVHANHWCMVPRSRKFSTEGALPEGQAWGRSFRTLSWDEPSWTVAYGNREVHVHPGGKRRLSIYEAMLLQSFPHDYVLTGNISAQTRLISEAVPPRLGWHLAVAVRRSLQI